MTKKELISGKKAIDTYRLERHHLIAWINNKELTVYSHTTQKPYNIVSFDKPDYPIVGDNKFSYFNSHIQRIEYSADLENHIKESLYDLEQIEQLAKRDGLYPLKESKEAEKESQELIKLKTSFLCKPGTTWKNITMTLVANDMLRIKTSEGEG